MDRGFYSTGQFAHKAAVSVRTLRFYDKEGLLSPTRYTESGYRLYSDNDLINLQQILALKFLGFSLDEIRVILRTGPKQLRMRLAQQKAMMAEKRAQIEKIVQAIDEMEKLLQVDQCDWDTITHTIQVIQMGQDKEWVNKYFTPEQLKTMQELSATSYSESAQQKIAGWEGVWTEEDQKRADEQWGWVQSELKRLVAIGADPAGSEVQAWAKITCGLIDQFTGGDPEIETGLNKWWENFHALPEDQKPTRGPSYSKEEQAFCEKAINIYRQQA